MKERGIKEMVLVGLLAEKCIYSTSIGGIKKGYKTYVVPEAIIGKSEDKKEQMLRKMKEKGVEIISSQAL